MKFKRIAAAAVAAMTTIVPFSSGKPSLIMTSTAYAVDNTAEAVIPDWVPNDLGSALDFRNTYGATHAEDGFVCVVFKEHDLQPEGKEQASCYDVRTTDGVMKKISSEIYTSDRSETGDCYEVVLYQAQEQGDFAVALTDKSISICILPPEQGYDPVYVNNSLAREAGLSLNFVNVGAFYSFSVGDDMEITETDVYGWMPDSMTEYRTYMTDHGQVSTRDDLIVFCLDRAIGTAYSWCEPVVYKGLFKKAYQSVCRVESETLYDGGTVAAVYAYRATDSGKDTIRCDFARSAGNGVPLVEKTLVADCTVTDNGKTISVNDSYLSDAGFTFSSYSIYSGDLKFSATEIYDKYYGSDTKVITSMEELTEFLEYYLNESAAEKFAEQYSDKFFEHYVLMLSTYLDPYKGRVFKHGLRDVVYEDGYLTIDYTSVIDPVRMRTSNFDILRVEIPKEQYNDSYVIWKNNEILESDTVRIKVVDIDTGKPIEIPYENLQGLFPRITKNFEGENPYYWNTKYTGYTVHDLYIDEKYLPEEYEPYLWNSVIIDEYPDDSADIVFNVRKKDFDDRTAAIDIIATTVKGINHENIINSAPSAVTSVEELKKIMDSWFANDILQRKILSKYGDEFFKDNVLLLERQVDSTGGDGVGIKDVVFSDGKISVYYIKRSSDYGICNTDHLCIMQVIVPKSKYNDDKAEWKCFGDVNGDNVFGVADMLTLQKWLSGSADVTMPDWTGADLCRDGQIDVFDLCMLRKQLINCDNGNLTAYRSDDLKTSDNVD